MIKINILLAALVISTTAIAQDSTATTKTGFDFKTDWSAGINTYNIAPGIVIGKTIIKEKLHVRLGFNTFAGNVPDAIFDLIDLPDTIAGTGTYDLGRIYLAVDYQIKGIFGVTAGAQVNTLKSNLKFALTKPYQGTTNDGTNNISYTIPVGTLKPIELNAETPTFAPFLGLTLGRTIPEKRIGFRFEVGAVFQGKMTLTSVENIFDTGINDTQNPGSTIVVDISKEKVVTDAIDSQKDVLNKFTTLPYISLGVNVKIN